MITVYYQSFRTCIISEFSFINLNIECWCADQNSCAYTLHYLYLNLASKACTCQLYIIVQENVRVFAVV